MKSSALIFFNKKSNLNRKKVIQNKVDLAKILMLKKKYKIFFQRRKFNFFFFLNKIFNSLNKKGKKNISINLFLKMFNILKFKNKNLKFKSLNIYTYFLQIAINLLPHFLYINKYSKGKTILLPWIKKNKHINKRKIVILGVSWFKKALNNRKEKTFLLKFVSELENIRINKADSINYKNTYYKNFYENIRHIRYIKNRLWI